MGVMGIRRSGLAFEGKFVQIPNEWMRDEQLSRRARGLLAEIMTHRVGWQISINSLRKSGKEGRDAISSALNELKDAGYLRLLQPRGEGGRFNEVEYELCDPATGNGFSVSGGFAGSGSAGSGSAAHGESDTKNTRDKEDQFSEDDSSSSDAAASDVAGYSDEVKRLCALLAERVEANGHKVGVVGKTWWSSCERLMRLDGYKAEQIEIMIRWSTADEFWAANIRSMPTLREKFSTLRAQRNRKLQAVKPSTIEHGRGVDEILQARELETTQLAVPA